MDTDPARNGRGPHSGGAGMRPHWLNRERLTAYPRIFLLLYLVAAITWMALSHQGLDPRNKPLGYDFAAAWAASHLALSGTPAAAYEVGAIARAEQLAVPGNQSVTPWLYPPNFFLLILPLSLLPFYWSYAAFIGGSFLAYFAVVRRACADPAGRMLLFAFPGVFINAAQGQYAFVTAALIGGALVLLPRAPVAAGVLFGLTSFKPQLALLVPLALVCGGQWRVLLWAGLSAALSLALGVAVLGVDTLTAMLAELPLFPDWLTHTREVLLKVPSFFSFALLLGLPRAAAYALHFALAGAVAAALGWIWLRRPGRDDLRAAALVTAALLFTPYVVDYDLAWLALPIAWLARDGLAHGWRRGEREILALAWVLPLLVAPVCAATGVQLGPFVLLALFLAILRRVLGDGGRADAAQQQHEQQGQ